ncbi:uncharacterized protein LOC131307481 isoform X2 [Rhododendron vialii]|uniref:uncharacterized protein LOC131307481 isoform X2 n=1 Tax=Rhododendron vialii TaxID=182163 RepID=UPI00265FF207|nr:uncharacterized protein LOC131307481 isoform X2 [Rhododendron vialii]
MGSLGGDVANKAMWLYPKIMGFNPTERWGHSASYSDGFIYVFGGCCGGLHFSDVIVLNLDTMAWTTLVTTGQSPGPRDSHSAVLVGHRMIVFGGTNGSKKVNDLHILDLRTSEWTRPDCKGVPPSPRESHTATLIGDEKLVIFGGSGEGDTNYLNDLHVLDLKTMRWSSPEIKGNSPVPRDSHSAVAVGTRVFVYGGDCGDRYEGDIDVFDLDTLTWSRLVVQGSSPGVRAGHTAVTIGAKVYVIGGVGEKQYYNDVWVLDISACSWNRLEIRGHQPQGRFSHTAIVTETDIVIYGGCGEDEHPVNELLVLQLGNEHPNGRYNISLCKIFGNPCNQQKRRLIRETRNNSRTMLLGSNIEVVRKQAQELELESNKSLQINSDAAQSKRKRSSNAKVCEIESEPEEHSLSLSQHSSPSPSQSDQEQTPVKKGAHSITTSQVFPLFKQKNQISTNGHSNDVKSTKLSPRDFLRKDPRDFHILRGNPNLPNSDQHLHAAHTGRNEAHHPANEQRFLEAGPFQNLVGADIRGKIDGAFDSGYLMTAIVNGKIFRGVLFAPGPEIVSRGTTLCQNPSPQPNQRANITQPAPHMNHISPPFLRHPQQQIHMARPSPVIRETKLRSDLQGVVLTLGGPGGGDGGS